MYMQDRRNYLIIAELRTDSTQRKQWLNADCHGDERHSTMRMRAVTYFHWFFFCDKLVHC